jgi:gamma-glutamylcyclotransferase
MKGRCPDSLFVSLARLDNYKWHINSTQYANITPSPGDVVYGSLFFLSPRDEAGLDESEGVPWLYEKKYLTCTRINPDGSEASAEQVPCMTYVDVQRQDEGVIMHDYIIWINKAIREATPLGLPADYVEKYIRPYIPATYKEDEEQEIQMVRVMSPRTTTIPSTSLNG